MLIQTLTTQFAKTNSVNVTASSFASKLPTVTKPSGDGILAFGDQGGLASNAVLLVPFGVGADATGFSMNVIGWRRTINAPFLYVPVCLATFTACTLDSGLPGVDGTDVPSADFFCSAMTLGTGNSGISVEVVSPGHGNGLIAHTVVVAKGFELVEVYFSTGSSATSCNALYAKL